MTNYNSALWWQGDVVPEITKGLLHIIKNMGEFLGEKDFKVWLGTQVKSLGADTEIPKNTNTEGRVHIVRKLLSMHGIQLHCS